MNPLAEWRRELNDEIDRAEKHARSCTVKGCAAQTRRFARRLDRLSLKLSDIINRETQETR